MASSSRTAPGQIRNWTELPDDVTASILSRLGAIEMLTTAQLVCMTWRNVCKDPLTWRTIDIRDPDEKHIRYDLEKISRHAVDRSSGNVVDISVENLGTDELLKYITDSSRGIKRLRLVNCHAITNEGLCDMASKLPLLEDLEISYCSFSHEPLEVIGASCPLLKSFKFNKRWNIWSREDYNDEALAIAGTMHNLRHLQLFRNKVMNDGLQAILDCCIHLDSLDLRQCFNLNLRGKLGRRCAEQIRRLRLPDDRTVDYDFGCAFGDNDAYHEVNLDGDGFSDVDLVIGDEGEDSGGYEDEFDDYDMEDYDTYPWIL